MKRFVWLAAFAACGGAATESAPVAPAPAAVAAAPAPGVVTVTRSGFGGLTADTSPTIAGIGKALGSEFKVTTDILTKRVKAARADGVAIEVVPSAAGTKIDAVRTTSDAVRFPWDARVGMTLGTHRHWARMTCEAGSAPGIASCYADPKRSFRFEVAHEGAFPPKDAFADKVVQAMVWKPAGGPG